MMAAEARRAGLLHDVSRSIFWNAMLLPVVTATGVLLSILIRRRFGLESGYYDVALGIANSILFYSGLGLAGSLQKFLPEVQLAGGGTAVLRLVARLGAIRLAAALVVLMPLLIWSDAAARAFNLGPDGALYFRLLAALIAGRTVLDFAYRALDAFFQQLSVNVLSLLHGVLDISLVLLAVVLGMHMAGVVAALGVSSVVMAVLAVLAVRWHVRGLSSRTATAEQSIPSDVRIWKLSGVTYFRDLSLYFATPAFASPALVAVLGGPEPVALFATSYFVASSTVTLVVSGFRGIYRPAFAHVMAAGERAQLHRAFDLVNKLQILAVVPAGIGLAVMVGDYLPLLYGSPFVAAVPVARVLVVLLFAETAIAAGALVLWVDEQYRPVLTAQAVMIAGAPLFVWTAAQFGLVASAWVLGGSRLVSALFSYAIARRRYNVRYPWRFFVRVASVSGFMALCLVGIRAYWPTSPLEAITLTALGAAIFVVGLRMFHVLGRDDLEILGRTSIPGRHLLSRWLSAS